MTATADSDLTFVDADGHVLEPPTGLQEFTVDEYRDRIWHLERDDAGTEWIVADGAAVPANTFTLAGAAGFTEEDKQRALEGEFPYSEACQYGWDPDLRIQAMDKDGIAVSVLYPTQMLAIQAWPDLDYAVASCRAYNDWLSDHCARGPAGRLYGVAVLPQQSVEASAEELRRVAGLPNIVGGFLRPNPTADWQHFNHEVYDPIWRAASDTNLALGFHPYLDAMLPGAAQGLRVGMLHMDTELRKTMPVEVGSAIPGLPTHIDNMAFVQAIANPVDMMTAITFITMGGVCERFPDAALRVPRGERRLDRAVAGAARPPRARVPVGHAGAHAHPVGVLPPPVLHQLRPRRGRPAAGRHPPVVRRRPHRVGVGLPAPRRQVPRRHRGADGGDRDPRRRRPPPDRRRERPPPLRPDLGSTGSAPPTIEPASATDTEQPLLTPVAWGRGGRSL